MLLLALFMYTAPQVFLPPYIYTTFLSTLPPLILLAIGLTFVIGAGEIDLSFPSVIAFSGFVFAVLFKEYDLGWIAVVAALASGLLVGFVNGVLIAKVGVPSFIATLAHAVLLGRHGDRAVGRQILCAARRRGELGLAGDRRPPVRRAGQPGLGQPDADAGALDGRSSSSSCGSILNRHRFGEHVLFIGDSNAVSRVVGIDVDREKIKLFTLMGGLAAIAAIMLTLENKNYFGNQGQGYLLTAIASVLIGGTSIFGGRATIVGTVFGCFIISMIEAGPGRDGPDRRAGCARCRGSSSCCRSSSTSTSTSRSGARALLRALLARQKGSADHRRPDERAGRAKRAAGCVHKGGHDMTISKDCLIGTAAAALARRRLGACAGCTGRRAGHVHADGRQCRRRRDARPPDRRRAGRGRRSASTSRSSSRPGRRRR